MGCGALLTPFLAARYTNATKGILKFVPAEKLLRFRNRSSVSDVVGEDEERNKKKPAWQGGLKAANGCAPLAVARFPEKTSSPA
jgi:hypothetical protein